MTVTVDAAAEIDALRSQSARWQDAATQAGLLTARGGALARVLARPEFTANAQAYATADIAARAAQERQQTHTRRAGVFGFLATVIAALMLYLGLSPTHGFAGGLLGVLYVLSLGLAFASAAIINMRKPYRDWGRLRGEAEALRIRQFKSLLETEEPHSAGELPFLPLALEYVRAYLIDDQRQWYARRSGDFRAVISRNFRLRVLGLVLVAMAAVPTVVAIFGSDALKSWWPRVASWSAWLRGAVDPQMFALAGVAGGALQTLITALSAASLAERNATTYGRMAETLGDLGGAPLQDARAAAAADELAKVGEFWTTVAFELIGEHREWGGALQTAQLLVLDRLGDIRRVR